MAFNSTEYYLNLLDDLAAEGNITDSITSGLIRFARPIYRSDLQEKHSKPMLWIGLYIALASLLCILAMVADLLHGLRNRKLWFPCRYFSINSASLQVIAVAMKLPVDLSGSMPGDVDQAAKLGSMAFMCTMMANLLPSLAAMDDNKLLTNVTGLGILVITLVVNICIQINTGVVSDKEDAALLAQDVAQVMNLKSLRVTNKHRNSILATIYVTILLLLLIIYVCSSFAILRSKQIIVSKYQQKPEKSTESTVEKLQQHVRNYWIMAGRRSSQFISACSVTTTASGVICVIPTILHTLTMAWTIEAILGRDCNSDYKWSMLVILIVQFIGVIVGTIAPFARCFATIVSEVMSMESILNHIKVFAVESYWSWRLSEWKEARLPYSIRGHKMEVIIHYSRNISISFCIQLQEGAVVMCKMIALIPYFFMICVLYCFRCLKMLSELMFQPCVKEPENSEENKYLPQYVLQPKEEEELAERTLMEDLLKSMNRLITKGRKERPKNLMKLIREKSGRDFPGVENFDNCSLLTKKYEDCWSLPVVTLTAIAVSLPDIRKKHVDSLLRSVREGLKYVTLVEETLNANGDYASVQKAAETLWREVYFHSQWLGNKLPKPACNLFRKLNKPASTSDQVDRTRQVIEWFKDTARKMECSDVGSTAICATLMHRITKTILHSYQANDREQLFDKLSAMIADIMAACLTNLPQVIIKKCEMSAIEKREANVQAAARLLSETDQIIDTVQELQPPRMMNPIDLPFIGKWRADLGNRP